MPMPSEEKKKYFRIKQTGLPYPLIMHVTIAHLQPAVPEIQSNPELESESGKYFNPG